MLCQQQDMTLFNINSYFSITKNTKENGKIGEKFVNKISDLLWCVVNMEKIQYNTSGKLTKSNLKPELA